MNILVVAAHPDDEVLGVGGTIARYASDGARTHVVFLADGVTARPGSGGAEKKARFQAARDASQILGAEPPTSLGLPDNRLDTVPLLTVVQQIEALAADIRPVAVYTHHGGDLNVDHAIAHRAVLTACRPVPGQPVHAIYGFEVPSSTEWGSPDQDVPFRPVRFVDVTDYLEKKLAALDCYAEEMRLFPHARSREAVEALARLRGSQAGLMAAEAFTVLRQTESD